MVHKLTGNLLDTKNGTQSEKWIFVMSTSKNLYVGEVWTQMLTHRLFSSFANCRIFWCFVLFFYFISFFLSFSFSRKRRDRFIIPVSLQEEPPWLLEGSWQNVESSRYNASGWISDEIFFVLLVLGCGDMTLNKRWWWKKKNPPLCLTEMQDSTLCLQKCWDYPRVLRKTRVNFAWFEKRGR